MAARVRLGPTTTWPRLGQHDQAGRFDLVVLVGNRYGVAFVVQLGQRRKSRAQIDPHRVARLEFHRVLLSDRLAEKLEGPPTAGRAVARREVDDIVGVFPDRLGDASPTRAYQTDS